ncbi:unnamed protein product [Sphenostylis stenocarpa]|uniref:Kunitz inhibitor ST1-like n=1 Tax=Sphenostylis stenocarpa TaxID=92480 RepID=A0AA86V829_9FABA|nr:unnamed protein product [Sphenostylis stenocarpa]
MKSTTLFSLFLLSAFATYLPSTTVGFVLDTDGNPVRNGGIYHIIPVIITGNGGGPEFAATGNETCPLTVAQNPSPFSNGQPVQISSLVKLLYVSEGLNLYLRFTFVLPCAPTPSIWTVVKGLGKRHPVKLTGYDNTIPGWFRIEKVPVEIGGYNLLFCPNRGGCGYVGIDNKRRFVVTKTEESRLWIRFKRLSQASTATATATA